MPQMSFGDSEYASKRHKRHDLRKRTYIHA